MNRDREQLGRMAQNFKRMNADHISPSSAFDDMARGLGYAVIFAAVVIGVCVIAAIVFG